MLSGEMTKYKEVTVYQGPPPYKPPWEQEGVKEYIDKALEKAKEMGIVVGSKIIIEDYQKNRCEAEVKAFSTSPSTTFYGFDKPAKILDIEYPSKYYSGYVKKTISIEEIITKVEENAKSSEA